MKVLVGVGATHVLPQLGTPTLKALILGRLSLAIQAYRKHWVKLVFTDR